MKQTITIILILTMHFLPQYAVAKGAFLNSMPETSCTIEGFSVAEMKGRMQTSALHHIEGIWQFTDNGSTVAIERYTDAASDTHGYRMILVSSANRSLRPGTVMGHIAPTAKDGQYSASIYTSAIGPTLILPHRFTLKLQPGENSIVFQQHKSKFAINLWRTLPYMWRYSIRTNQQPPSADGCRRIYPAPTLPREPRYL